MLQVLFWQNKIGLLHSQIEAYQNTMRALLIERQTMKLQIVVKEKERVLQEGDKSFRNYYQNYSCAFTFLEILIKSFIGIH